MHQFRGTFFVCLFVACFSVGWFLLVGFYCVCDVFLFVCLLLFCFCFVFLFFVVGGFSVFVYCSF